MGPPDAGPKPEASTPDQATPDVSALDQQPPDAIIPDAPTPDAPLPSGYVTWSKVSTFPAGILVSTIHASGKVLLVGGGDGSQTGSIQRSDDGGKSWSSVHTGGHVTSISMDGLYGAATERGGKVYTTIDGGKKWSYRTICWKKDGDGAVAQLGTVTIAAGMGWLCAAQTLSGAFKNTLKNWASFPIPFRGAALTKVGGKDEAVVVGWRTTTLKNFKHFTYRSSDQGKTWTDTSSVFSASAMLKPEEVILLSSGRALAVDALGYYHDYNAGLKLWQHFKLGTLSDAFHDLAYEKPSSGQPRILITGSSTHASHDDGKTWSKLTSKLLTAGMNAVAFSGAGEAYLGLSVKPGGLFTSTWQGKP